MGLTTGHGPLGRPPATVNYEIDGPQHKLFFEAFPRRVRARLGGAQLLDTEQGMLLHETGILPRLYVPLEDLDQALLVPSDHTTHCPFKGDASYWSVEAGGEVAENAVWAYPEPIHTATWLAGYASVYFEAMDEWLDEDEVVHGHLRDPYHRVDARRTQRTVRVSLAGELLAESNAPVVISETGLPNRWYLPAADIREGVLNASETKTHCPYKGDAEYRHAVVNGHRAEDVAWIYAEPLEDAAKAAGHFCFDGDKVTVEVLQSPSGAV